MKIPDTPPDYNQMLKNMLLRDEQQWDRLWVESKPTDEKGRYFHWDKLKHRNPPQGFSVREWWAGIKLARNSIYRQTMFLDKKNTYFQFAIPDCVLKHLHWLDQNSAGTIGGDSSILLSEMRDTYLISSLIREAINSSQLEGASTAYQVAKQMIRQGRTPMGTSEQMILNNYRAMDKLRDFKEDPLTVSMILELHEILTSNTLKNSKDAGKFRITDDIDVIDPRDQTVLHIPPKAEQISERMEQLCKFANEDDPNMFVHPVIKAIVLHFMLAYIHPFIDGNGRTARALFYWSMARNNYWLTQYISISEILKKEPGKYAKSFLYTETDDNDLTYFIIHQLSVIKKAIDALHNYLVRKGRETKHTIKMFKEAGRLKGKLNSRQISFLKYALENPGMVCTVLEHQNTHGIAYETARKDLMKMSDELKLLIKEKRGKAFVFISPEDLKERIEQDG